MGYLLPIQPIQSQMYANRLNLEAYNFANIDRVNKADLNPDFLDDFKEFSQQEREKNEDEGESIVIAPSTYQGYIYPNPVNLSPVIAQVVGKGIVVNAYV
ncbi:hypothetical protein FQ087_10925 [Sporosarcina sp. ANT_H38]|uniref:hypothetical protein n=1 Tax=Sporosarcina sp. ANT_H38 TaxID=2597358 RepID=UPI0011F2CFED|nr:hypothetical protein [Sporosarcina sp. ANT_H38]KAA0966709.1 hypothetical protein FQ087_10925 [Sporosarcina sp. ANT_H38]